MPPSEKKIKYADGEKVLCFHGPLLYEAKIQKTKTKDRITKYFVHYAGWNSKWDEWVAESRVVKHNDDGLKKQKELKQQHSSSKKGKRKDAKDEKKDESTPSSSKRRKGRSSNYHDNEPTYTRKIEVKINIPQDLRRFLLDDSDFVLRQKQLVPLPKPENLTVRGITEKYHKYCEDRPQQYKNIGTITEVCKGINEYFNVTLGTQLLYKFERTQYSDLLKEKPNKELCDMYGCEHLLRLFVKLSDVLTYSCLDERSMEFVIVHIHDFLDYLTKSIDAEEFVAAEYENTTPDYHRRCDV